MELGPNDERFRSPKTRLLYESEEAKLHSNSNGRIENLRYGRSPSQALKKNLILDSDHTKGVACGLRPPT